MPEERIGTPRDSVTVKQDQQGVTVTFDAALADVPMFGFSFSLSWAEANTFADLTESVGLEGLFFSTSELSLYLYRAGATFYFLPLWSGQPPTPRWSEHHLPGGRELPAPLLLDAWRSTRAQGEYTALSSDVPTPLQAFVIPWSRDLYGRHESADFKTPAIVGFRGYPDVALVEFHARILADLIRSVRTLSVEIKDQQGSVTIFPQPGGSLVLALQASTWDDEDENEDVAKFSVVLRPEERAATAASLSSALEEAAAANEPLHAAARQRAAWMREAWGQPSEVDPPEAKN